ncbi:MAG: ABC transporter transmembrane domain-containing protein, partial [Thermoguttaceae bacterium]
MNFSRVVRMAIRYKLTFAASIVSALMVAILWGANIGTVYPVVEVIFKDKSMHQWIDGKIVESQGNVAAHQADVDRLHKELAAAASDGPAASTTRDLEWDLGKSQAELAAATKNLERYEWLKPYINRYLPTTPFRTLVLVTLVLVVLTIVKDVFLVLNNVLVARLSQRAVFDLRKLFYRRTLRMDLATFGEDGAADLMSRFTNDMNQVAGGLDSLFGKLVREPLKAIACLVGAALICWRLLLLTLIITPLAAFLIRWLAKTLKRANRRAMEEIALLYGTLEETFRSIKIVKAFTNEQQERRRFHDNNKRYYHKAMAIARYDSLSHPMTEVLGIFTISLVMVAGGWLIFSRQTTLFGIRLTDGPLNQ